ncbi:MAG: hypothetical protein JXB08_01895 [Bacilli bacterium]|nr:hypothetical protein [Bacilli bacterium]MBN2876029.1 hypothetical protein [Bacilli bacterium]
MPGTLIAIGIIVLVVVIYILSYALNEKTAKPEECEDLECTSCKAADCSHRK